MEDIQFSRQVLEYAAGRSTFVPVSLLRPFLAKVGEYVITYSSTKGAFEVSRDIGSYGNITSVVFTGEGPNLTAALRAANDKYLEWQRLTGTAVQEQEVA